jgi:hypothetical protein
MAAHGFSLPLTPAQAAQIGRELDVNAVVLGSLTEVKKYQIRKGWRRLARLVTSQREYVDAVLAVSAVDAVTGIILVSRANVGEYQVDDAEKDVFVVGDSAPPPTQQSLENSLDAALTESYHRTLAGLGALPFKARVVSAGGGSAVISFGSDVGLKNGAEFVLQATETTVTNPIGDTYAVMGAPAARLKVSSVAEQSAALEIEEGEVNEGDVIQAVN